MSQELKYAQYYPAFEAFARSLPGGGWLEVNYTDDGYVDGVTNACFHVWLAQQESHAATITAALGMHEELFMHCLSNGIYNAWGNQMSCTRFNECYEIVYKAANVLKLPAAPSPEQPWIECELELPEVGQKVEARTERNTIIKGIWDGNRFSDEKLRIETQGQMCYRFEPLCLMGQFNYAEGVTHWRPKDEA